MADNEKTSAKIAKIAAKAIKTPEKLTKAEIKSLAASALTQAPDKKPVKKKKATKKKPAKKEGEEEVVALGAHPNLSMNETQPVKRGLCHLALAAEKLCV
jgi:hypothetical protein